MKGFGTLILASFLLAGLINVVTADCCYTSTPTFVSSTKFLLNLTVTATPDLAPSSHYLVQITFPDSYIMEGSQAYKAVGTGNVVCSTQRGNDYGCEGWGSEVFRAEWGGVVPEGSGVEAQVVLLEEGRSIGCSQRDWCPLPSDAKDDGLIDFGPLGRRPQWFAVVLAAAGGICLAAIGYGFLKYRNGRSGAVVEKDLAARHDEVVGGGTGSTEEAVQRVQSIRRVPTVREVRRGEEVGGKGTLLGNRLGVGNQQEGGVGGKGTLVGAMLQQAALQRNGTISGRSVNDQPAPERAKSLRTLFDPVVNVNEYPPMSATGLQRSRSVKSVRTLFDPESTPAVPPVPTTSLTRSKSTRSVREQAQEAPHQGEVSLTRFKSTRSIREQTHETSNHQQESLTRSKSTRSIREESSHNQQSGLTRSKSSRSISSSNQDLEKGTHYWMPHPEGRFLQVGAPGGNNIIRKAPSQQQLTTTATPPPPRKKSHTSTTHHHHESQTVPPYRPRSKSRTRIAPEFHGQPTEQKQPPLPTTDIDPNLRRRRSTLKNKTPTSEKKVQDLAAVQDELERELKTLLGEVDRKRNGVIGVNSVSTSANGPKKELQGQRGRAVSRDTGRDGGW